jgi:hypothetical protein
MFHTRPDYFNPPLHRVHGQTRIGSDLTRAVLFCLDPRRTMTGELMTLRALVKKCSDADLLREMNGFTAQPLMERAHGAKLL